MILGIQLLGLVFGLWMAYITFTSFKRKELSLHGHVFWQTIWIGLLVLVLFPGILSPVVKALQFSRAMDVLVVCGFLMLLAIVFHNYILIRKTQRRLEEVVRNIAKQK